MANTLTPFGFRHFGTLEGFAPTYGMSVRRIAAANATPIFRGDPVTSLSTGYIQQAAAPAGTVQIAGIFQSCEYLSLSQGITIRSKFWPGSDANGDVKAFLIDQPQATFIVQSGGAPIVLGNVGNNVNFIYSQAGNTTTGYSGATIDPTTVNVTATLPMRIIRLYSDLGASGSNGADNTTNFNFAVVTFNNQDFKSLTGI